MMIGLRLAHRSRCSALCALPPLSLPRSALCLGHKLHQFQELFRRDRTGAFLLSLRMTCGCLRSRSVAVRVMRVPFASHKRCERKGDCTLPLSHCPCRALLRSGPCACRLWLICNLTSFPHVFGFAFTVFASVCCSARLSMHPAPCHFSTSRRARPRAQHEPYVSAYSYTLSAFW
jgi:hypothetical protein